MYKHLKLALGFLAIIVNTLLYLLIRSPQINKIFYILLTKVNDRLTNPTVRVHGNTNNFSNNNLLIMSNHYHGFIDINLIHNLYYKHNSIETLHTIVKADYFSDPTYKSKIVNLLSYFQTTLIPSWYFIPYKRGDKEDGKKVRNRIVDALSHEKNIFVFPDGKTFKNGIPQDFKKGTFELAVANKLRILPITIKFAKDIGMENNDPLELLNLFDNVVDIYIHDLIDETDECYTQQNPEGLKDKVFDIISAPLLPIV
jgi:1-acyl-sn-glycerol-3-phosphate acyltransferase